MNHAEMETILRQTLDDLRLSRSEKRALGEVLGDLAPQADELAWLRNRAFELAHEQLDGHENHNVLDWLEEVVKVMAAAGGAAGKEAIAEAYFTPGSDATARITSLIRTARRSVDVCVFTITDNRIAGALLDAHQRGVALRIITDDDKTLDRGSDIDRLFEAGIPVRTDRSQAHMHHKFAIFDGNLLLTGSYNWTRGAANDNQENFVVVDDPRLLNAYAKTFASLWSRFE